MRSMTFSTGDQGHRAGRAYPAALTVLVHALLIAGLAFGIVRRDSLPGRENDTDSVFVLMPALQGSGAPNTTPVPASTVTPRDGIPAASPGGALALHPQAGRSASIVAAPVDVAVIARPAPEAVLLPAITADSQADQGLGENAAVSAVAPAPPRQSVAGGAPSVQPAPRRMVPVRDAGPDGRQNIIVVASRGSRVGTYTFPALAGVDDNQQTELFRVELDNYPDIETAMANHVIAQIRARYPDEIKWESRERGGVVRLSMRVEDHDEAVKFIRIEMFGRHRATTY